MDVEKKRSHFVMSEYDSMGDSNMAIGKVVYELLTNNNSSINSTITRAAGLGNRRWYDLFEWWLDG